jgi:CHAT domain-containing protein/Tfp pilus assembly protein PilF
VAHALELNVPVEREISGGESHRYQLSLESGQFVRLVVDQRGIDLVEVPSGPDGQTLAAIDGPNGTQGPEPVLLLAETGGSYSLEVRASNATAGPGRYEIRLEELRPATPQDRSRVDAQQRFMQALTVARERSAPSQQKAVALFEQALALWRAAGDRYGEALALHAIGGIYGSSGDSEKALGVLNEALAIRRAIGDRHGEASTLNNIGLSYVTLGEYQKVLDNVTAALALQRTTGDRRGEAQARNNLCLTYRRLGEYQRALTQCIEAVALHRAIGNRRAEADNLNNLGLVHKSLGEYERALDFYRQALSLKRAVGDRRSEMTTVGNIGEIHQLSGDRQKALERFNESLAMSRELGDRRTESVTLGNIGAVYASAADQAALGYFAEAVRIRRDIVDRPGEAVLLFSTARANRDFGNLTQAETQVEGALEIIESLRAAVVRQELRDSYFASVQDVYEFQIDLLAQLHAQHPTDGFDARALHAAERARARGLLDILGDGGGQIHEGVETSLIERERSAQRLLTRKSEDQVRLLSGKPAAAQVAAAAKELETLTAEYEQVRAEIRARSPRYAALMQPATLNIRQIQQDVLDDDTLLLEYALGKDRSFLWAVTRDSLASFVLPDRDRIERSAQRALELLRVSHQRQGRRAAERAVAELSGLLLGPVADRLGNKRLVIVADGVLQYVPFAALRKPLTGQSVAGAGDGVPRADTWRPLIVDHEIVSLPSASVLAVIRRESAGRRPATKTVAVLADPVLQAGDVRVNGSKRRSPVSGTRPVTTGGIAASSMAMNLDRLPFSRREAEAIVALSGGHNSLKALDFEANRATATGPELADYRIVHFATHALIDSQFPDLSGVVLSLVDREGQPQDGFLRLGDVYNLRLGADLVVLSACQTALGKPMRGEGLVGLVRGFMYAGSPRVVASVWDVKDEATAELMKRFYERMLVQGQRPGAALRAAQIAMWQDARWRAPYYWAGFTLQGEWK